MELSLYLILLVVIAGFIKGFIGFGLSLILISVLFHLGFQPFEFLPILVPIFVSLDALLFFQQRKNLKLEFKENFALHYTTLMTLFIGILFGTYLLLKLNSTFLKISFAVLVLVVIFFLVEKVDSHIMKIPSEKSNSVFGLITGVLTGLFTMNAVPLSLYLLFYQYPKDKYMTALVTFLVISDILLIAVYMFKNLFSMQLLQYSGIFLLITLVGFFAGSFLRKHSSSKHFKAFVILILAINSLKIIFNYFKF